MKDGPIFFWLSTAALCRSGGIISNLGSTFHAHGQFHQIPITSTFDMAID
jgi:hypothetical protein